MRKVTNSYRVAAYLCSFIFIAIFIVYQIYTSNIRSAVKKYDDYTISYGETYWDIAKKVSDETGVYQPKVQYELTSVNKIPADRLQPGQVIKIPIY